MPTRREVQLTGNVIDAVSELKKVNRELRLALAELAPKYQKLRTTELAQSWVIGAMSGALIVFGLAVVTQL